MKRTHRRSILKTSGIALVGGTLSSSVSASSREVDAEEPPVRYYDIDGGIFVAAIGIKELLPEHIEQTRQKAVSEFVSRDDPGVMSSGGSEYLLLSSAEASMTAESPTRSSLVGYSLQFENGYPRERKFRIPSNASEEARQRYIRDALSELEQNIVTVDSGDVVDADPGWGDPLFFAVDEADVGSGDEDEGIAFPFDYYGKFNGEFALYGGRETNEENQEYGCTIGCTQVPGSDMDNSNYDGSSYETECEISPYGPSDLPTITDWGPDEDNTTYIGNVSVDEISFGADAGGPYGEVTISPSSTDVSAQYDETNFADDGPIKTLYEIEGADEDTVQKLGNSAVFITDPDNTTICDVSLTCAFSEGAGDWPNSETLSENIRRWDLDE